MEKKMKDIARHDKDTGSSEWSELIRREDREEFRRLHNITIHPRLVVDGDHRLRMIVLRSGSPTTVAVPETRQKVETLP